MRLSVHYDTSYHYSQPTRRVIQLLRVTPLSFAGQSVLDWRIDVDCDARLREGRDGYGNVTHMLYVDAPVPSLRVTVTGTKNRKPATRQFDLIDRYDEQHGISAMMRTTGYSLSITGQMQVRGEVRPPGVWTPDECMPAEAYIAELRKRGMDVRETTSNP